jgi:hypothetical protein
LRVRVSGSTSVTFLFMTGAVCYKRFGRLFMRKKIANPPAAVDAPISTSSHIVHSGWRATAQGRSAMEPV